jgi:hypothetical protein
MSIYYIIVSVAKKAGSQTEQGGQNIPSVPVHADLFTHKNKARRTLQQQYYSNLDHLPAPIPVGDKKWGGETK